MNVIKNEVIQKISLTLFCKIRYIVSVKMSKHHLSKHDIRDLVTWLSPDVFLPCNCHGNTSSERQCEVTSSATQTRVTKLILSPLCTLVRAVIIKECVMTAVHLEFNGLCVFSCRWPFERDRHWNRGRWKCTAISRTKVCTVSNLWHMRGFV